MKNLRLLGGLVLCLFVEAPVYGATYVPTTTAQKLLDQFSALSSTQAATCMKCLETHMTSGAIGMALIPCIEKYPGSMTEAGYFCELQYVIGPLLTPMNTTCKSSCSSS